MSNPLELYTFKQTTEQLEKFLAVYDPDMVMIPPDEPLRDFTPRPLRTCRFCGASAETKTFRKDAHIVPHFLGNDYLVSDFECDDCNALFSGYENDLSDWLGIARSILQTKGKSGVPTFKSMNDQVTARLVEFFNNKAIKVTTAKDEDSNSFDIDLATGKASVRYKKKPYTPVRVYKSLLKIALSMISTNELEHYRAAFMFLQDKEANPWFTEFGKIMCHHIPMNHRFSKPIGMTFTKKDQNSKLPRHVFLLYYETYIFSLPLPFNALDIKKGLYSNNLIDIIFPPPIIFLEPHELSVAHSQIVDLSSHVKVKGEEDVISFEMSPQHLNSTMSFDPKTGISKPTKLKPSEIVGFFLVPASTTIDPSKLNKDGIV